MAVVRLDDGSLLVSSPAAPTQQCLELLRQCGTTVSHIVIPNNAWEHSVFAPAVAAAFPDAQVWAVPGALDDQPGFLFIRPAADALALKDSQRVLPLTDELHPEWPTGIQVALLKDAGSAVNLNEATLYIEACKAVCFTDIAHGALDTPRPLYTNTAPPLAALLGIWNRLGSPFGLFMCPPITGGTNRERLTQWVRRVWQWDADTVLAAHGEASLANGRLEIARAFGFLQVPELQEYLQQQEAQGLANLPGQPRVLAGGGAVPSR